MQQIWSYLITTKTSLWLEIKCVATFGKKNPLQIKTSALIWFWSVCWLFHWKRQCSGGYPAQLGQTPRSAGDSSSPRCRLHSAPAWPRTSSGCWAPSLRTCGGRPWPRARIWRKHTKNMRREEEVGRGWRSMVKFIDDDIPAHLAQQLPPTVAPVMQTPAVMADF